MFGAADCVVSLDVVSWLGTADVTVAVVGVSGPSGGLKCPLGHRSHQDGFTVTASFNNVTGVGFHGSQIMAFKRVVSPRRLSTLRVNARLRTMPFGVVDQVLICFAVPSEPNTFEPC